MPGAGVVRGGGGGAVVERVFALLLWPVAPRVTEGREGTETCTDGCCCCWLTLTLAGASEGTVTAGTAEARDTPPMPLLLVAPRAGTDGVAGGSGGVLRVGARPHTRLPTSPLKCVNEEVFSLSVVTPPTATAAAAAAGPTVGGEDDLSWAPVGKLNPSAEAPTLPAGPPLSAREGADRACVVSST